MFNASPLNKIVFFFYPTCGLDATSPQFNLLRSFY